MEVRVCLEAFDPWREIQNYQAEIDRLAGQYGATSLFIGTMRDFNEGDDVKGMTLEHYPGMTERQLEKIIEQAGQKWPVLEALLVHRVGDIFPHDPIVLVAVWTSHRGDAFDACRYIMEALKAQAPFWKKELLLSGLERWVEKNTDGYQK
ncbi:molybdenum cofactor biosynthesis protein MoaE [Methylomarinum sp. Ch1-1]|uniref:Molybdopterin synthase catalytic subunit n=1 Tax=Methylomarinum roseum TaxID=3067653 RepID=A0AAU7NZ46_9GAMM|nr:molybdenum cofactor biosynthesis protein MoaE [Methylomarinum sp. Ch1-1]MDP4521648.1 molybdenum cofactor biosynthesis protein MoaE [Methylomarinum sp. Ch1-1]